MLPSKSPSSVIGPSPPQFPDPDTWWHEYIAALIMMAITLPITLSLAALFSASNLPAGWDQGVWLSREPGDVWTSLAIGLISKTRHFHTWRFTKARGRQAAQLKPCIKLFN